MKPWRRRRRHGIPQHDGHDASHRPDAIQRKPFTWSSLRRGLLLGHHRHAIGVHRHRLGCARNHRHAVRIGELRPEEAKKSSDEEQRGKQAFQDYSI